MSPTKSPKPNVIRRGAAAVPQSGNGKFLRIGEDDSVGIVPLVELDDLISIDQHEFWEFNPALLFPCIGDGCPACAQGNKPKYKAFLPVVTTDGDTKIYAFGASVERQFEAVAEEIGGIAGRVFKVRRKGSGLTTKYTVVAVGKKMSIADVEVPDAEAEIQILTAPEIRARLSGLGGEETEESVEESPEEEEVINPKAKAKPAAKAAPKAAAPVAKGGKGHKAAKESDESEWEDL